MTAGLLLAVSVSSAFAGGHCSPKVCTNGPPLLPRGHEEGTPAPVRLSPNNQIVIDVTGAGVKITNSVINGIVIDVTGAGIVIDITGAGLINRPNVR